MDRDLIGYGANPRWPNNARLVVNFKKRSEAPIQDGASLPAQNSVPLIRNSNAVKLAFGPRAAALSRPSSMTQ